MSRPERSLLAATLLFAAPCLAAQDATPAQPPSQPAPDKGSTDELEKLKKEVQELKDRLDGAPSSTDVQGVQSDLENFKYQYQRDRETKSALSNRNLLITGLVQTRYSYYGEAATTPVAANVANSSVNNPVLLHDRKSSFDTPVGLLSFNGLLHRDYEQARNLSFAFSVASSPSTSNAGLGATNINSFLTVLDANITYQALPTIENDGNRLSVTLGQQLVPFGLEANTTEELKPVINNALFVAQSGFNLRQVGVIAKGEFFSQYDFGYNYRQALISFAAGLVNGNGPNRGDENNHKDFVGRIAVTLPAPYDSWLRELRVGTSYYEGYGVITNATTGAYIGEGRKVRKGYDFYYNHFPFGFTYEQIRQLDSFASDVSIGKVRRFGQTATFFYSFGQQFLTSVKSQAKFNDWWPVTYQPFLRYDNFDPNQVVQGDQIKIWTAGLNVFFAETTKLQINYNRRVQENGIEASKKSNEILVQFQFGF